MIKLDENTDSILPYGLKGTPFETVYKALQAVASTVWPADASGLRASIGWAWYALNDPASLVSAASGKQFLQDVLISEQAPLVKSTQTQSELVDLLIAWLEYKPTFGQLEALYKPYSATVDIRPITDAETQAIYPVTPVHGAFYVIVTDIDLSRPLTLAEALTIAERATPMGSKPFVLYDFDAPTHAYAELGYGDVCIYAGGEVPADVPVPPQPDETPNGYIVVDSSGRIQHSIDLDGMFIHQIQHSVDVVSFYFTSNGAAETENSELESGVDVTLYNADGTVADDDLYDGAGTLTYTQASGNMFEAADGGDLISLQSGALVMSPNADYTALSVQVEKETAPDVVLKVAWGDTVNVPAGYEAYEVRTFVGYAFKSYYDGNGPFSTIIVAYPGKDEYFDNIDGHSLIQYTTSGALDSMWPLLVASQGYQIDNTTGPHMYVLDFGAGYKNSTSYWAIQDQSTNGTDATAGDFSVYLRGNNSPSSVPNAITSGYPVRYLWFIIDENNNAVWHKTPEAFKVPHSLWSFQNGTFSWLGNSEDTSSLAWYYKHDWELFEWEEFDGVWFYVHCRKVYS